jgi:hypothetical protein
MAANLVSAKAAVPDRAQARIRTLEMFMAKRYRCTGEFRELIEHERVMQEKALRAVIPSDLPSTCGDICNVHE